MLERVDVHSGNRNSVFRRFRAEHVARYVQARAWLDPLAPLTVVDAACGSGYGFEYLAGLGRYVGLDVDRDTIRECRRRYHGAEFRHADLDGPDPLGDLRPGAIVSFETAEHLCRPREFLAACHAALPPGGRLVFSAPTSLTMDFDPYHRRDWPADRWRDALRRAGFAIDAEREMGFVLPFTDFLNTTPTTWSQRGQVARFLLHHPRYLAARLWHWGVRNRFEWVTQVFLCRAASASARVKGGRSSTPRPSAT
jgi:SAM-dependent methyltransferase